MKKANRKNASPPLPLRGNGREIGRGGWMEEEIKMRKQKGVKGIVGTHQPGDAQKEGVEY